jgi:molecular chaperone DnaK
MVKEAEKHAAEDARKKEEVEVRNQADSAVFTAEKFLRDYGDKLPEDAKKRTQELIDEVNSVKAGSNMDDIKSRTEALVQQMQQLGGQMYQNAEGAAPAGNDGDDEDVVDAEYSEN